MMSPMDPNTLHVACQCAAWCQLCDGYRAVFDRVAAELRTAGPTPRWHWIDIEDDAALAGDVDVETFPTIVVCDGRALRFAGPVTRPRWVGGRPCGPPAQPPVLRVGARRPTSISRLRPKPGVRCTSKPAACRPRRTQPALV